MTQGNIFNEDAEKKAPRALVITRQQKNILTKQQQNFNRLVKRIEALKVEVERITKSLDSKLDFYGKHIYPLEKQFNELNKEATKSLFKFFKAGKFITKGEKAALKKVIAIKLRLLFRFEKDGPEEELKQIFKEIEGISYEDAAEAEFNDAKDEMESMFEDFGFDVDMDDFNSKMTAEEFIKRATEMQEKLNQQREEQHEKSATRKKTKKQLEKEEREKQKEEARTKNISSIYKQLAKLFHPDLERDEDLKLQKEELMKQLTNAYENNDLHTLLRLELSWIQKEENTPDKLTDDKLGIYNEVLKEQVIELEDDIHKILHHPRYEPLAKFAIFPGDLKSINIVKQKQEMEAIVDHSAKSFAGLKYPDKALQTVKAIVREFHLQNTHDKDFEALFG